MDRGFDNLSGHLTDLKDMVIDQNEWYEEMFYDGSSNASDCYDINDTVPTESDASDHPKGMKAGDRMKKAHQRKENLRQFVLNKESILGAEGIQGRRFHRTGTKDSDTKKRNSARKPRTSVEMLGSSNDMGSLDCPVEPLGGKSKFCGGNLHLKIQRSSTHKESPKLNVVVGEYAPVSDLIKSFQNYDNSMNISDDPKISRLKRRYGRTIDPRKFMTPEGEEMQAIDEHEEDQEEEQVIDEDEEDQEEEQVIDEDEKEQDDSPDSSFGDASPDNRALKSAIYTNNQAPDVGVKN
jgi:hypothetical protein